MKKVIDFTKQVFRGNTIGRIIFNWQIKDSCRKVSGNTIDFAGDGKFECYNYLPKGLKITKTNYKKRSDTEMIVDLNENLPFEENTFENILFFNAFYIIKDQQKLLKEFRRILKDSGNIYMSSPFISNEMPEPHDYNRLTYEGLEIMIREAGFTDFEIIRYGERFSVSAHLLHPFFIFNFVRFFIYSLALFLDKLIPISIKENHPTPIGYFCIIRK